MGGANQVGRIIILVTQALNQFADIGWIAKVD
jgi:hypothetical protein